MKKSDSDSLCGTIADWKRNHRGVFSTGGPWKMPDLHVADSHRGKTPYGQGDVLRNLKSGDHHRTGHPMKSSPSTTHLPGSAIAVPKRATRQPVTGKRKRGVQR